MFAAERSALMQFLILMVVDIDPTDTKLPDNRRQSFIRTLVAEDADGANDVLPPTHPVIFGVPEKTPADPKPLPVTEQ